MNAPATRLAADPIGPPWNRQPVMVFAGQHDTHIHTGEDYDTRTLASLFTLEPSNAPKGAGLAFIPSTYRDHDGREHRAQRERGSYVALTGDVDKGDHPLDRVQTLVRAFAGEGAWLIFSSAHAREGSRRWRIIMPLDEPVGFELWHDAQNAFYRFMETAGIPMDWALDRAAQPVYLPNVPERHHKTGDALRGEDGAPLFYERVSTGTSAPGLRLDTGPVAAGLELIERQRVADAEERERIRIEAERKRANRPQTDNGAIIDDFNASTSVETLLELYRYQRSPRHSEDWRSPHQQGETFATRVIGTKWVSLSSSDVAAGLGSPHAAGCYGDAYDLMVHYEHGGDQRAAFRMLHAERKAGAGAGADKTRKRDDPRRGGEPPDTPHPLIDEAFERPEITVRAGALHHMATEAEDALIRGDTPFYVRGGIVRPIVDDMPAAHGRRTKVARLASVEGDTIVDHLSRVSNWLKYNVRKQEMVATDPPRNVALTILSRDGEWRFPRLAGVITTPTLRPDGTILSRPGYDAATQLLLLDPPEMPSIASYPAKAEAAAALALLDSLLDEFPFIDAASRSVALSGLITPIVRGAMAVAPLHATTAPVAGSGKSYIIDLASAIATGQRAPVIAAGRTEEETEKRLGAALLNGQPIVSIDNVNGQLGGDMLCQMIERPIVSVRPLGVSKLVKIESRATCFATGNNIHLVGDMTRRTIMCSLDPNMERPELRDFQGKPFELVLGDRGKFVSAALTIARSYIAAGSPGILPPLASFEQWSGLVRSALVWLGKADPVLTMEKARAEDPVISTLSAVLNAWHDAAGSTAHTVGAIKTLSEVKNPLGNAIHSGLREALCEVADDGRDGIAAKRLGHFLGRHHGRVVDGLKFVAGEDAHAKQKTWRVVKA